MDSKCLGRGFVGVLLVAGGIACGLYAGLWWAFIGGIVQLIEAAKATPVEAAGIAVGIARIVFAGFIGTVTAILCVLPGLALLKT